ncbi:Type III secretion system protein PrgJ [Erwinia amylovora Ea644]|uniref:type III secretion system inner rod subunit SctI n=1 Tax=Erwinia amylovora TaxID=552 RepID=UPI0002C95560|nr:type III secretion system inner rod subunit SctI [Erwinia amylovora]CCP03017.1 Type III secretion system protein PrgJ [Erwinia amylovora Ea644]CCP07017.1 Type III secretion system protein PrgJ [Erwinia amylovora MR1]
MSYHLGNLSSLIRLAPDTLKNEADNTIISHNQTFNDLVSSTFKDLSENNIHYKSMINTLSESSQLTANPEYLAKLQNYVGEYTNYISLVTTLARKGISAIETLEKSQ